MDEHAPACSGLRISRLDHLVLNVRSVSESAEFYEKLCAMERRIFEGTRVAMHFGDQKLNLNPRDPADPPSAPLDFCLVTDARPEQVSAHLRRIGVPVAAGPVKRHGARGAMTSIYVVDPDGNIVELASYRATPAEL